MNEKSIFETLAGVGEIIKYVNIPKAGGISGFDPKRWLEMKTLIDQAVRVGI